VYRLVGYFDEDRHEKFSQDKTVVRTYIPNHADDIVAVTDEQFVVLKLKYPDIETLGFYSFPLDYFD
jgi:hypothetical protein